MLDAPASRPLCVLLVVEPGRDGVFRHVELLAHYLVEQAGMQVHLAYSSVRGSPDLDELVRFLTRHGARTLDLHTTNAPQAADAPGFLRLRRLARAVRPDVIHAHSSKAGALARALAWTGIKARYFYTPNAYYQMYGPDSLAKRAFMAVERLLARTGTTMHVSASEADYARRLLGVPPARQQAIVNSVDCDRYRPAADPAEKHALRRRFQLPPEAWVFGTIARYSEQKDPLTLYRAVVAVLAENPGLCFAQVGQGDLRPAVARLLDGAPPGVQARILQIGRCDDLPGFYRMLDVFVLPSRYEGMALALLEAMSSGLSLILSRCPGNIDLEAYALNGVQWMPAGDAEQLAARMRVSTERRLQPNNHREIALQFFGGHVGCRDIAGGYLAADRSPGPRGTPDGPAVAQPTLR